MRSVFKNPAWQPKPLSEALMQELDQMVKYSDITDKDILAYLLSKHTIYRPSPSLRKKLTKEELATQRDKLRFFLRKLIERTRGKNKPYPNNKCPECGKRLAVARCLMCDMEAGLVVSLEACE